MLQYLVLLGAVVQLVGIAAYLKETLQGKTKPNKVTWLMWSIAPLIAGVAALADGAGWAALPTIISGSSAALVLLASFTNRQAYWRLETFDYLCGLCSILALILWYATREPIVAITFAILSDAFATAPTVLKAWTHPKSETPLAYTTGLFNALTSFSAIRTPSISSIAFPLYWAATNCCIILILYRSKNGRSK
ncbi:MAG: hypothetical protein WCT28_00650 [Patescibacteria group bacterium]|jgi:hypothetical protein